MGGCHATNGAVLRTIFCFIFALIPATTFASESFTLNIPQRLDASQETGEVRILLGLSVAPAGSHLVVNGAATLNLGDSQMVAGDSVSFAAANGNHVLITYSPRSNFGADFCAGGSAVAKNIPMRFTGPQDVVDFAMSSFVIGAPAAECSKVSRRVADLAATIVPAADAEPRRRRRISNGRACGMCIAF